MTSEIPPPMVLGPGIFGDTGQYAKAPMAQNQFVLSGASSIKVVPNELEPTFPRPRQGFLSPFSVQSNEIGLNPSILLFSARFED